MVAVVRLAVAVARGQVDGAGQFFVYAAVARGPGDDRADAERKFAQVARARVGVQYLVKARLVIGAGAHDAAL